MCKQGLRFRTLHETSERTETYAVKFIRISFIDLTFVHVSKYKSNLTIHHVIYKCKEFIIDFVDFIFYKLPGEARLIDNVNPHKKCILHESLIQDF